MGHPVCIFTRLAPRHSGRVLGNKIAGSMNDALPCRVETSKRSYSLRVVVATLVAAVLIAFYWGLDFMSAIPKSDDLGMAQVFWPITWVVVSLLFLCLVWPAVLAMSLVVCALLPYRKALCHPWLWATLLACSPLFYVCLRLFLSFPSMQKYYSHMHK